MRLAIAAVALSALLVGCGGSDEPESEAEGDPTPTEAEVVEVTMKEACPRLEAAWDAEPYVLPDSLLDEMAALEEQGDLETRNAMAELVETISIEFEATSSPGNGGTNISPMSEERIREAFRSRCQAVGSSSFS